MRDTPIIHRERRIYDGLAQDREIYWGGPTLASSERISYECRGGETLLLRSVTN